ncbi:PLP-dependent aminotransferase family protein [Pseudomonas sp. RIT-PI-S]|uniref:aminotransferase-like domain-containing protein n=1 Tax=Pseudomonas sp. RIT-PI-S TaxID=3035295 RepID=UPI0021D8A88D|nr:PLP-dependent aminotransferase family protein [Pseudomonas sp. RIT-PI-S]
MFQIDRSSKVLLVDQIRHGIVDRIETSQWVQGARLPSVRALARQLGVSIYTVTGAYEDLVAQQVIESRPGTGYFVLPGKHCGGASDSGEAVVPSSLHGGFLYRSLDPSLYELPVSSGYLPPAWLAEAVPPSVTGRLIRDALACSVPAPAAGGQELRRVIARKLHDLHIAASSQQIVVTVGATHAFSMIRKVMLREGDYLLVEDPSYLLLQLKLIKTQDFNIITVPRLSDGPDMDVFEAMVARYRPRLFLTQTLVHNPTGGSTSPAKGHKILSLAEKYDFHVVEDDVYGPLSSQPTLRLASLDGFNRCFYLSGFSKVLSPALRLGYAVAPAAFVERLVEEKMAGLLCGSAIDETIVTHTLQSGRYQHHLDTLTQQVMKARATAREWLGAAGVAFDDYSPDGIFLWGRMPGYLDLRRLIEQAHQAGILLAPGSLFSHGQQYDQHLRFNVTYCNDPRFKAFIHTHLAPAQQLS